MRRANEAALRRLLHRRSAQGSRSVLMEAQAVANAYLRHASSPPAHRRRRMRLTLAVAGVLALGFGAALVVRFFWS